MLSSYIKWDYLSGRRPGIKRRQSAKAVYGQQHYYVPQIEEYPLMHIFRLFKKPFTNIAVLALLPLTLISLTYLVLAKDSAGGSYANKQIDHSLMEENIISPLDRMDRSSEFIYEIEGTASYYGRRFHNRRTANGERFDMHALTAAHKKLPFGAILKVTNQSTGKVVFVRINDRGPYVGKRILDLSYAAAKEIDGVGLPKVKIETLLPKEEEIAQDHYFGYSYHSEPVCLPGRAIDVIDSTSRFADVVEKYKESYSSDEDTYIFVSAAKLQRRERSDSEYKYFIAKVRSGLPQILPSRPAGPVGEYVNKFASE